MSRYSLSQLCIIFIGAIFGLNNLALLNSCGVEAGNPSTKKPKNPSVDIVSLINDSQLTSSIVNATHGDVMAAASDQSNTNGAKLQLRGDASDQDATTINRVCKRSEDQLAAIVTVSANVNRLRTKTSPGGRSSISINRTGTGASTRTWSVTDGTPVLCNAAGTAADVSMETPDKLKLDISFERSRVDTITVSRPKGTRTATKSFTSSGSRSITWNASDSSSDGETYKRRKSVAIRDVKQTLSMTNKDGLTVASTLLINTTQAVPLEVEVERQKDTHTVVSKKFISGQTVVKKDDDGTITTTYNGLKVDFTQGSCAIASDSGSAQIVVTDSTGSVLKTLTLSYDSTNQESTLKDSNGNAIEDFDLDPCDPEDTKS